MTNFVKSKEFQGYYFTEKVKNQSLLIEFFEEHTNKKIYYFVAFTIFTKKKHMEQVTLKTTGKIGLSGLLWAKKRIIEFETYIKNKNFENKDICIAIGWDDNRRRRVYERGLQNLGFKFKHIFNHKYLIKSLSA